jgi:ABC-type nitrate/sulfonate/bicarbonate transport system substrate-binding protein
MPRRLPHLCLWVLVCGLLMGVLPAPSGAASAGLILGSGAVAKPSGGGEAQGGTAPVRVGTLGIIADAPVYIAADLGYFAEQGLAPSLERFDTGAQMVAPLAAGQLDAGAGTPAASLFNAIGRDLPLRIVADNARVAAGRSHIALVARPDLLGSGLRDYGDLRGLRIAVNARGTGTEIQLDRALARGGLTLADVNLQEVPFPDMLPALANGSLDAGITLEPFLALGQARNAFEVFHPVGDFYPDQQIAVLLYSPQFAGQTDAASRFMVAYLRGLRDFADAFYRDVNREQIVDVLARNTVVQDRALYTAMIPHQVDRNGQLNREGLAADLEWYAAHGYLTGAAPDLNTVIDMRFVDYALGQLGRQ